jgi:hypothetical protein
VDELASRIIIAQKNALNLFLDDIMKEFLLISKWVWDGSTGHSKYKQRSLEDATDSDIFITSVVHLQLYSARASGDTVIIWQNSMP